MEQYALIAPNSSQTSMSGWGRRFALAAVVLYGVCFLVWRLLVLSPLYERWWPLQLSEVFTVWLALPLPVLLLAAILWRSRWIWIPLLLPLIWFGGEYGGLFLPVSPVLATARAESTALRVMTFNTWNQHDKDGEFLATIEQWQPDVIAMQEVNSRFYRDLVDSEEFTKQWPYHVRARVRARFNIAIFSKVPFELEEADDRLDGCHCLQAILDWDGEPIRIIAVHIRAPVVRTNKWGIPNVFDASNQPTTYAELLPRIRESREPLIVLGDFNTTEQQPGYRLLSGAGLENAHVAAGWGFGLTYPAPRSEETWLPFSLIRIDHIFYDEAWRAMRTWTTPLMGSDHQALVADLQWMGTD